MDACLKWLATLPKTLRVADFGCGDAELARRAPQKTVLIDPSYTRFVECECVEGFAGSHAECVTCPPNTFADERGLTTCRACPPHSGSSVKGLISERQCECDAGHSNDRKTMYAETEQKRRTHQRR